MNVTSSPGIGAYFVDVPPGVIAIYSVSAGLCVGACILSLFLIIQHLKNYTLPLQQRYIVRIVFIVPLYALYSFLAILFVTVQIYFAILRDAYEAFVLFQFFKLCVNLLGGEDELVRKLAGLPPLPLPWPFCRKSVALDEKFVRRMKQGILQYVIIRPLTSVAAIICEAFHVYGDGTWSFTGGFLYVQIVNNISFTVSLYCLFCFYLATKDELRPSRPLLKFLTIKIVVFFCFWQALLIAILVAAGAIKGFWLYDASEAGIVINNLIICCEMFCVAVMHIFAYPYDVYRVRAQSQAPLIHDVSLSKTVLQSVKHTLTQKDTLIDTLGAFGGKKRSSSASDHDFDGSNSTDSDVLESLEDDSHKIVTQARR